jgi:antitoxin CptB
VDDRIKPRHGGSCLAMERPLMSGSTLSSSALDERRRRILFRAWRRGVREMDLIMGRFVDAHLPTMNEDELAEFERLLDVPDPQALAWIIGGEDLPREFDTPLFARLRGSQREAPTRADETP